MHRVISAMCEKTGLKYDDYFKLLQLADYSKLKHSLLSAIKAVSREPGDKEKLSKELQALGASTEVSQVVATCLWVRKEEIRTQLVKATCDITHSKLEDFDWKLKVLYHCNVLTSKVDLLQLIMSSSQLGSIHQPVVALDFVINENGQKRTETLELSNDELSYFVSSLEAANKVSLVALL